MRKTLFRTVPGMMLLVAYTLFCTPILLCAFFGAISEPGWIVFTFWLVPASGVGLALANGLMFGRWAEIPQLAITAILFAILVFFLCPLLGGRMRHAAIFVVCVASYVLFAVYHYQCSKVQPGPVFAAAIAYGLVAFACVTFFIGYYCIDSRMLWPSDRRWVMRHFNNVAIALPASFADESKAMDEARHGHQWSRDVYTDGGGNRVAPISISIFPQAPHSLSLHSKQPAADGPGLSMRIVDEPGLGEAATSTLPAVASMTLHWYAGYYYMSYTQEGSPRRVILAYRKDWLSESAARALVLHVAGSSHPAH